MTKKPTFYARPENHDGITGFMFFQMDGAAVLASQFIPREAFQDFVKESGINADQIKYV